MSEILHSQELAPTGDALLQVVMEECRQLRQDNKELKHELALYEKAYRAVLDQLNALEPDARISALHTALEQEKEKKQQLRLRLRELLGQRARRAAQPIDPVVKSMRRHKRRRGA